MTQHPTPPDTKSDTARQQLSVLERLFADDCKQQPVDVEPAQGCEVQADPCASEMPEGVDPEEVERLHRLLRDHRCEIYRLPGDGIGIDAPPRWMMTNWSEFCEVCQLFWSPVGDQWLDEHWAELRLRRPTHVQPPRWRHE